MLKAALINPFQTQLKTEYYKNKSLNNTILINISSNYNIN
jgi:hypothetical protein